MDGCWNGEPNSILNKTVHVVWNREVGRAYSGKVTDYNSESKRHKVEFDDGDVRWYRMERKIFSIEEGNGASVSFRGHMQIRPVFSKADHISFCSDRSDILFSPKLSPTPTILDELPEKMQLIQTSNSSEREEHAHRSSCMPDSSNKSKKQKSSKAKKNIKCVLVRTHMIGTLTMTDFSFGKCTLEGFWDESKKQVSDILKRDQNKTFRYVQSALPSPVAILENCEQEEGEREYSPFEGGNCSGWFSALMTSGEKKYQQFEDAMMLRVYPVEPDSNDEGSNDDISLEVRALGSNAVGVYRVFGFTSVHQRQSTKFDVTLVREYIPDESFEEEKIKFNKELLEQLDIDDSDFSDGTVRLRYEGREYIIPEVTLINPKAT